MIFFSFRSDCYFGLGGQVVRNNQTWPPGAENFWDFGHNPLGGVRISPKYGPGSGGVVLGQGENP